MLSSRRRLLLGLGALSLPLPGVALAAAPTDRRFVFVVLRGGLDGIGSVVPYADPNYRILRGEIALASPGQEGGILDLDGRFGLHPALAPLETLWRARQLAIVHAVATPYRQRSHFDGQDLLENGTVEPRAKGGGWLNRSIALLGKPKEPNRRLGLAVGSTVPLLLRGEVPVATWSPPVLPDASADFIAKLSRLYRDDSVLGPALAQGVGAQAMSTEVIGERTMGGTPARGPGAFKAASEAAGKLLASAVGPRVAVLELNGFDTHAQQRNRIVGPLAAFADGMIALKDALGPAWTDTVVLAASEFGRTAQVNGTLGTDHGTAGVAFILGGRVAGGRVLGRWPGLAASQLYEGRDLAPTTDLRAVAKALLKHHLGLPEDALGKVVFPDSRTVRPLPDLMPA
ncbi:MAG: DUF1501 domain-containing protein [Alphaproteobacteria bacterium]|nr:DUF1501 domain-containing protein [Alphaproteobacteria bacterium]